MFPPSLVLQHPPSPPIQGMKKHIAMPEVSPRDAKITSLILEETEVLPHIITQPPCCRAAPSPALQTWGEGADGQTELAVSLQHPQPSVHLPPPGHPSTQWELRTGCSV